ncbi:hypothetical protein BD410DRAFT_33637 [Rickenella mellea]|uniref:RRM domain-containing protein n=1 Tax=Rickenella mellea TaxID=50990 RepID=A0A4R5XEW0_9AGAM|nr:hypothetical protein BD410DRAFT_33637 [Rickenella mellea]
MSSPESPELIYRYSNQPQPRPESPNAHHYQSHNDQFLQQAMYNTNQPPSDFSTLPSDRDLQLQQPVMSNNVDNFQYRNNSVFNNFMPSRIRQQSSANPGSFTNGMSNSFSQPYDITAAEVFGTHQPLPPQHQQSLDSTQGIRGYEYVNGPQHQSSTPSLKSGGGKPSFSDPFGTAGSGSALLQSHQVMKPSLSQTPQQQAQQQQQSYSQNTNQPYMNGLIHTQSQTPYGPHVSSTNVALSGVNGPGIALTNGAGANTSQEEISTIFVVGFPEDMQEREFQNMFTFSPGFEAATLKIPNKDSTAYGPGTSAVTASATAGLRGGAGQYQLNYPQSSFGGSNDPYNLVTVNQGGVVVDARDGTTTSWPSASDDFGRGVSGDLGMGLGGPGVHGQPTVPPRKQIIGFAKFRSRAEALTARDVLQGRRVDIEKGAVLKAEMAKKNLHTKRGVGPLGSLPISMNGGGSGMLPAETIAGMTGIGGLSGLASPGGEALSARERELGALGAMGLGGVGQRRDRVDAPDEDREREQSRRRREMGSISSVGGIGMMISRGPRERAEEDERERERRRKEKENRLRSSNSTAFDAFHSVGQTNGISIRNPSLTNSGSQGSIFSMGNSIMSPTENLSSYFPSSASSQPSASQESYGPDGWPISRRLGSQNANGMLRTMPPDVVTNVPQGPPSSHESSPPHSNVDANYSQLAPHSGSSRSGLSDSGLSQPGSVPSFSPPTNPAHLPHPSLPIRPPRPLSPSNSNESQPDNAEIHRGSAAQVQLPSSSSSSISGGSHSSGSSSIGIEGSMGNMNIGTHQGMISPQLPSPASGGSSGTKNASDQNPPINTLYVGNLPTSPPPAGYLPNHLEDSLRSLFSRCPGFRKLCYRQKSNGPMCFVEFEDVSFATKALNDLYGHQLNGLVKGGIRLSYSKNPLGVRTPTNAVNGNGLQHQQQQAVQQAFGHPTQYAAAQDAFSQRQSNGSILSVDMSAIRNFQRDPQDATSPTSSLYPYAQSPPRFVSPPPSSGFVLTPQANASSFPRSQAFGLSATSSSFSPFGLSSSPFHVSPQPTPADPSEHLSTLS